MGCCPPEFQCVLIVGASATARQSNVTGIVGNASVVPSHLFLHFDPGGEDIFFRRRVLLVADVNQLDS